MKNIINMLRLRISNFFRKHQDKIKDLAQKLIMVAMGIGIATIILASFSGEDSEEESIEEQLNVYKPTQTVIKGSDISKEQFKEDKNLINTFLEYCNNEEIEEAYNLISDECKEEKYPTLEEFQKYYYNYIFDKKRSFNLQSWISNSKFTVYKIRYSNNMLVTGTYDENDVYQDYITLNRSGDKEKISIGSFISSEECNIVTKIDQIEVKVINKKTYIEDEEYEIYIKNNTNKTILLDNLSTNRTIWLVAGGTKYSAYTNKLYTSNLTIEPGKSKKVNIKFMKNFSSNNKSKKIQFLNVIKDYDRYMDNKEQYKDFVEIEIKVGD